MEINSKFLAKVIEKKIEKMLRKEIKKFRRDTKELRKQKQGE
jgi:hypothetical protein